MASNSLRFEIEQQLCTQWCWAAVTASIVKFFSEEGPDQCQLVNQIIKPGKDCCKDCQCSDPDVSEPCNEAANVGSALLKLNHGRDIGNGVPKGEIDWEDLQSEIDSGQPIVVSIAWQGPLRGQSHAVVIYGYTDDRKVLLADPMRPGTVVTCSFDDFQFPSTDGKSVGSWNSTFRTF